MREPTLTSSLGLLILRVGIGTMMLVGHGWGKMMSFGDLKEKFPEFFGLSSSVNLSVAIAAEVFASILLILGIGTRFAAALLAIVMGVAAFMVHANDPWFVPDPMGPNKELALLYLIPCLALVAAGGGRFALGFAALKGLRRKKKVAE